MFIYRLVATIEDTEVISNNNKSYFIITIFFFFLFYFIISVHQIVMLGVGSETALILLGN